MAATTTWPYATLSRNDLRREISFRITHSTDVNLAKMDAPSMEARQIMGIKEGRTVNKSQFKIRSQPVNNNNNFEL
jgi:hypothetical protein